MAALIITSRSYTIVDISYLSLDSWEVRFHLYWHELYLLIDSIFKHFQALWWNHSIYKNTFIIMLDTVWFRYTYEFLFYSKGKQGTYLCLSQFCDSFWNKPTPKHFTWALSFIHDTWNFVGNIWASGLFPTGRRHIFSYPLNTISRLSWQSFTG